MKKWERIAASLLILIGFGAGWGATKIGFGSLNAPGPGFYPFWLALIFSLLSFSYFLTQLGSDRQPVALWLNKAWIKPLFALLIMAGYVVALGWLGFFSATLLMFLAWLAIIERKKWLTVILVSIIGASAAYLLFSVFLHVQFPKGILL